MPPGLALPGITAPYWARQFRSDNLEEVRARIGNKDGPHSRVARGAGPLGYAMFQVSAPRTNLGGSESGVAQTVRGHVHGWVLHLALPPGTVLRSGPCAALPVSASAACRSLSCTGAGFLRCASWPSAGCWRLISGSPMRRMPLR
ncbi:MAG: hypothetical protein AMXMBFR66_27250 [Pseudomonadota bacterium]